jgi:hypothetical protein
MPTIGDQVHFFNEYRELWAEVIAYNSQDDCYTVETETGLQLDVFGEDIF